MRSGDKLSKSTIMRLPLYYRTINSLYESGEVKTSSDQLGLMVGIDPTQVRRDLSSIGEFGRAGVGYQIPDILAVLEKLLGFKSTTEAVLVGVGRLGSALYRYPGFSNYGLKISGLFDSDPEKIGKTLDGLPVMDVSELETVISKQQLQMGIITVPSFAAQGIADTMVSSGIIAIWNFAPVRLNVPKGVMVRDEDLAVGLIHLSRYLVSLNDNEAENNEG